MASCSTRILPSAELSGQLTDEKEYRQLYITYANMDGKEKDVISVVNEGLQKGLLKQDYQTYLALAQAYYYSEQVPQAIEAWQKAAPLAKDGETYLNLARVLWQEGRIPEAKTAAQAALNKGLKKPAALPRRSASRPRNPPSRSWTRAATRSMPPSRRRRRSG